MPQDVDVDGDAGSRPYARYAYAASRTFACRKPLIVAGTLTQSAALAALAVSEGGVALAALASVLLGVGTALVYPTLIAAISDAVEPVARAPVVGMYRFWRDMGYVAGGLLTGAVADALGFGGAIAVVAALTAASGIWVAVDYPARVRAAGDGILLGNAS